MHAGRQDTCHSPAKSKDKIKFLTEYFILTFKQVMKQFVGWFVFCLSTFNLFLQTSSFPGEILKWPHL